MIHRNFSSSAMMRLMVGSTVKIVRPAAATEMAVPLVWLLAITVLAFVSSTATLVVVTRRYMGCPDADDHGGPVIDRAV